MKRFQDDVMCLHIVIRILAVLYWMYGGLWMHLPKFPIRSALQTLYETKAWMSFYASARASVGWSLLMFLRW